MSLRTPMETIPRPPGCAPGLEPSTDQLRAPSPRAGSPGRSHGGLSVRLGFSLHQSTAPVIHDGTGSGILAPRCSQEEDASHQGGDGEV